VRGLTRNGRLSTLDQRATFDAEKRRVISSAKWCGSRSAIWPGARRRMGVRQRTPGSFSLRMHRGRVREADDRALARLQSSDGLAPWFGP